MLSLASLVEKEASRPWPSSSPKSESKNKSAVQNRKLESGEMINYGETLLRNELNVLLTRGVNGLYVYAVDEELQQALKKATR